MKNVTSDVAKRVRLLVGHANSTARELSILSGCAHSLLNGLFKGRWASLRLSSAQKIAATCGVSVGWILAGEGPIPTQPAVREAVDQARREHKAKRADKVRTPAHSGACVETSAASEQEYPC